MPIIEYSRGSHLSFISRRPSLHSAPLSFWRFWRSTMDLDTHTQHATRAHTTRARSVRRPSVYIYAYKVHSTFSSLPDLGGTTPGHATSPNTTASASSVPASGSRAPVTMSSPSTAPASAAAASVASKTSGPDADIDFFKSLLRFRTVSSEGANGSYRECANWLASQCEALGLQTEVSLSCSTRSARPSPALPSQLSEASAYLPLLTDNRTTSSDY